MINAVWDLWAKVESNPLWKLLADMTPYVQHLQVFGYIFVSGTMENRVVECVDHLQEHFLGPCVIENGHFMPPTLPEYSIEMKSESLAAHIYPTGQVGANETRQNIITVQCREFELG